MAECKEGEVFLERRLNCNALNGQISHYIISILYHSCKVHLALISALLALPVCKGDVMCFDM